MDRSSSSKVRSVYGIPNAWCVESKSREGIAYLVRFSIATGWSCTCPGFHYRGHCSHIERVREMIDGLRKAPREETAEAG